MENKYINLEEIKKDYEGLTKEQIEEKAQTLMGKLVITQMGMEAKGEPEPEDFLQMAGLFAELSYVSTIE